MQISKTKFSLLLIGFAIAFLFVTNLVLNQPTEALLGSLSYQTVWQATISTVLSPIKMVLMGPLLPLIDFLRQDPDTPPPFFLVCFAGYWVVLALFLHLVLTKSLRLRKHN